MNNTFTELIYQYGLIAIFILILLEYSCFPLPSEIVLVLSGVIAVENNINFIFIFILSVFAGLLGSLICYLLGYTLGNKILSFIIKIFPKSERGINDAQHKYIKYSSLSVCLGRLIPLCRTYISFIAGTSKQNPFKYILYTTIGILFWNFILIFLGYKFYQNIDYVFFLYKEYKIILIILIPIFIILFIFFNCFFKKRKRKY